MADLDPRFQKILADKVAEGYADAALVDRAERYGAELDSSGKAGDELTVSRRTIVGIVAFILAVGVAFYVLLTTPILDAPTDVPAQSPAASAIHIRPAGLAT